MLDLSRMTPVDKFDFDFIKGCLFGPVTSWLGRLLYGVKDVAWFIDLFEFSVDFH